MFKLLIKFLAIPASILSIATAMAAPSAESWPFWEAHDANSQQAISHQAWDDILQAYVTPDDTGLNRVSYAKVTDEDKQKLKGYIASLTALPIRQYNRDQQYVYWANLYNALTLDVVLDHYPTDSILDIKLSGFFSAGPWKKKLLTIEGQEVSLDDIEHKILRPIWQTPLTHYAVNCASVGCPNLNDKAFTVENKDALLVESAKAFINSDRGAKFDDGDLIVSSIYHWFKEDFGNTDESVIAHMKQYANADLLAKLNEVDEINDHEYNWQLNEQK